VILTRKCYHDLLIFVSFYFTVVGLSNEEILRSLGGRNFLSSVSDLNSARSTLSQASQAAPLAGRASELTSPLLSQGTSALKLKSSPLDGADSLVGSASGVTDLAGRNLESYYSGTSPYISPCSSGKI